ncbi:MAG: hypothetical protein JNL98_01275 [Bryobacterales bacterium]|nr:hypothetical protein [Bryobacterales bacterium]
MPKRRRWSSIAVTFAGAAVLAASLVLAVATAALVDRCYFRPLPYPESERIAVIAQPLDSSPNSAVSFSNFWVFLQQHSRTLSSMGAWRFVRGSLANSATSRSVVAVQISAEAAGLLGVGATPFTESERLSPQPEVCWLSAAAAARFGITREAVAAGPVVLTLDSRPLRVAAILSPSFVFPGARQPDVFLPLEGVLERLHRNGVRLAVTLAGRIARGQSLESVRAETQELNNRFTAMNRGSPSPQGARVSVMSLRDLLNRASGRQILLLALCAGILFLSSWAGVLVLEVAATLGRSADAVIRLALGALPRHVLRLTVTRLVPVYAAAIPLALLLWSFVGPQVLAFAAVSPVQVPGAELMIQWTIGGGLILAGSLFAASVLTTSVVLRLNPLGAVQKVRSTSAHPVVQRVLLSAQISAAVAGVFVAAVLARSLLATLLADPGMNINGLYAIELTAPESRYRTKEARRVLYERLRLQMRQMHLVTGVTFVTPMPLEGISSTQPLKVLAGRGGEEHVVPNVGVIYGSPDLLDVLGIRILAGQPERASAAAGGPVFAYVNQSLSRALNFSASDTAGRLVETAGGANSPRAIRTVFADVSQRGLGRDAGPQIVLPFEDEAPGSFAILVRFSATEHPSVRDLERQVWAVDSAITIESVTPLRSRVARQYQERLVQSIVFGGAGLLAVLLVCIAIYGLVWMNVERSAAALAVRLALGATPRILRIELLRGIGIAWAFGTVSAAALALAAWTWLRSLITELQRLALDLFVFSALLALLAALASAWLGARRISAVNPAQTLRSV